MLRSVFTKGTQIPTFPSGAKKRRKVIQKNRKQTFLNCQKLALSLKILYRLGSEIYSEAFFGGGGIQKNIFYESSQCPTYVYVLLRKWLFSNQFLSACFAALHGIVKPLQDSPVLEL